MEYKTKIDITRTIIKEKKKRKGGRGVERREKWIEERKRKRKRRERERGKEEERGGKRKRKAKRKAKAKERQRKEAHRLERGQH